MKIQILRPGTLSQYFDELGYARTKLFDVRNHVINESGQRLYFIHFPGCGRKGKAPEEREIEILWTSPDAAPIDADRSQYGYSDYVVKDHIYVEERYCVVIAPVNNIQAKSLLSEEW